MKYNIVIQENFIKEAKPLFKKLPSIKNDIKEIQDNIEKELILATDLGNGFKKINLKIKSKGKGSSGGGRIITFETLIEIEKKEILFCSIYNKTDYDNIDIPILKEILGL